MDRIVDAGVTEASEGALVVDLSEYGKIPPCLLRKTDGTTLYATRDLAAVFHRWQEFSFARCLYVVGGDQRLHFRQLKHVLHRMGLEWEPRVEHIDFGMMRLPEGKMSTRAGRVVFLDDVLDDAVAEATRIIEEKNPDLADARATAEAVGVGAVVFNDLKRERVKDIDFKLEEVLSFEGDTGPYVQYTHARLASIARKGEDIREDPDWTALESAGPILAQMGRLHEVIEGAAAACEPSQVTTWVLGLARDLNSWIANERVLGQEPGVTAARLELVEGAKRVLSIALGLLGVMAPEEM